MHGTLLKTLILTGIVLALSSSSAWAVINEDETLSMVIRRTVEDFLIIDNVLAFFAFITGVFFLSLGFQKTYDHVDKGPQTVPIGEPVKYFLAGGTMIALPAMTGVMVSTFGSAGEAQAINDLGWNTSALASEGNTNLTTILYNFIINIYRPIQYLIMGFCYLAGIFLGLIALNRITKTSQEKAQGPVGIGTIATFMLAGVLFSVPPTIGTLTETIFGSRSSMTEVRFLALEDSMGATSAHAENVVIAVLAFLILVGIVAIIKGFFVLRDVGEGAQQATMMSGLSHIIAGAILVNFGEFANIIQNTLGIQSYGVLFST